MSDPNVKTRQRQWAILGIAAAGLLAVATAAVMMFEEPAKRPAERTRAVSITPPGTKEDAASWRATEGARAKQTEQSVADLTAKIKALEDRQGRDQQERDNLSKELAALRAKRDEEAGRQALARPLPTGLPGPGRSASAPAGTRVLEAPRSAQPIVAPGQRVAAADVERLNQPIGLAGTGIPPQPAYTIEMITIGAPGGAGAGSQGQSTDADGKSVVLGFPVNENAKRWSTADRDAAQTGPAGRKGVEFFPAGSFVRTRMLNGVDAPTGGQAQGNPLPMALHVVDTANLASRYSLDIRDCRFITTAWGDLSSERTFGRVVALTCIVDGETVEIPVKGEVIGPDGKAGIRGRLVTKQGQLLANALLTGGLSGIGRALQQAGTITSVGGGGVTQTIDGNKLAQVGIGGGLGTAANQMATYYLKAAEKLFPVIETDAGQEVEVLITKGAIYTGKTSVQASVKNLMARGNRAINGDDDE